MRRQHVQTLLATSIAAFLLTAVLVGAQRGASPETRFRDALQKQQVQGDLNGAIQIYQEIVDSPNASRSLKARALQQLAATMETQGQKAEGVYERIIKEFPEQQAAVSNARDRLAVLKPPIPAPMSLAQIQFGTDVQNVVATDGQRALYWNAERTTLFSGDIAGKTRREFFTTTPQRRPRMVASRDLSIAFLHFLPSEGHPAPSYAVVRTDGSGGYREVTLSSELLGVSWSFDNHHVVICKIGEDGIAHPWRLSIADGTMMDLLPGYPKSIKYAVLSPDNASIAFSHSLQPGVSQPGAFIKRLLPGREVETIDEAGDVAEWTLDGQHLVFAATDSGARGLYTRPVRDGRATAARTFVRRLGGISTLRPVTSGNSLIVREVGFDAEVLANRESRLQFHHASLDAEGRLSNWSLLTTLQQQGQSYPALSPDGTRFAYRTGNLTRGPGTVHLYTIATGENRELFRSAGPIQNCVWASQPPVLYCGQQAEGKTDILSIDVATGSHKTLASFPGTRMMHALSTDQRTLWMINGAGGSRPRWEIGADQEIPGPQDASYPSFDGRWAVTSGIDRANRLEFRIRPSSAANQAWEHLAYIRRPARPNTPLPQVSRSELKFTHDGNWLVYRDLDSNGQDALFRVSTIGGEPQRLAVYPTYDANNSSYFDISSDGRHFLVVAAAVSAAEPQPTEYWLLQNFLPRTTTAPAKK